VFAEVPVFAEVTVFAEVAAVAVGAALADRLMNRPLSTIAMIAPTSSSARAGRLLFPVFPARGRDSAISEAPVFGGSYWEVAAG
jgi:hypothetical protein